MIFKKTKTISRNIIKIYNIIKSHKNNIFRATSILIIILFYLGIKSIYDCKSYYRNILDFEAVSLYNKMTHELNHLNKVFNIINEDINKSHKDNIIYNLNNIRISEDSISFLGTFNNFYLSWIEQRNKKAYSPLGQISYNIFYNENNKHYFDIAKNDINQVTTYLKEGDNLANEILILLVAYLDEKTDSNNYIMYSLPLIKIKQNFIKYLKYNNHIDIELLKENRDYIDKNHKTETILSKIIQYLCLPSPVITSVKLPFNIKIIVKKSQYYQELYSNVKSNSINLFLLGSLLALLYYYSIRSVIMKFEINDTISLNKIKALENNNQDLLQQNNRLNTVLDKWGIEEKEKKLLIKEINEISYNSLINVLNKEINNQANENSIYEKINLQEILILSSYQTIEHNKNIITEDIMLFVKRLFAKECLLKNANIVTNIDKSAFNILYLNAIYLKMIFFFYLNKILSSLPKNGEISINIKNTSSKKNNKLTVSIIDNGFVNRSSFLNEIESLSDPKTKESNLFNQLNFNEEFILQLISLLGGEVSKKIEKNGLNKIKIEIILAEEKKENIQLELHAAIGEVGSNVISLFRSSSIQ